MSINYDQINERNHGERRWNEEGALFETRTMKAREKSEWRKLNENAEGKLELERSWNEGNAAVEIYNETTLLIYNSKSKTMKRREKHLKRNYRKRKRRENREERNAINFEVPIEKGNRRREYESLYEAFGSYQS